MILLAIALTFTNIQPPTQQYPEHAPAATTTKRSAVEAGVGTPVLQDDGYGKCPAFQHAHDNDPGKCFDNDDVEVKPHGPVLPVPDRKDQ